MAVLQLQGQELGVAGLAAAAGAAALAAYAFWPRRRRTKDGELPEPPAASFLAVLASWFRDSRLFDRALRAKYGDCFNVDVPLGLSSKTVTFLAGPEGSRLYHFNPAMSFNEEI
eukprot:tig00000607_g2521.t1